MTRSFCLIRKLILQITAHSRNDLCSSRILSSLLAVCLYWSNTTIVVLSQYGYSSIRKIRYYCASLPLYFLILVRQKCDCFSVLTIVVWRTPHLLICNNRIFSCSLWFSNLTQTIFQSSTYKQYSLQWWCGFALKRLYKQPPRYNTITSPLVKMAYFFLECIYRFFSKFWQPAY